MRLFAICPRIRRESDSVVATTAWRVRLLSLGAIYRQVVIDARDAVISVTSRYLWFLRFERSIRFAEIAAITYGYEDMAPDSLFAYSHDSYDWFNVGLRLKDDSELRLFSFIGDGTFTNHGPFPDWMYWSDFTMDISGSQERESRLFVDVLAKLVGVSVIPPRA